LLGFDEAIARAKRAPAAGADVAFVEAPQTLAQVEAVPKLVNGPCLLNVVAAGKTPEVALERAAELGFKLAIVPVLTLAAAVAAVDLALAGLKRTGGHPEGVPITPVAELSARAGAGEWDEVRSRYDAG
jgi:2-methylisocitrate lyase-like PEP mutase family enzyme